MLIKRTLVSVTLLSLIAISCGKKNSSEDAPVPVPAKEVAKKKETVKRNETVVEEVADPKEAELSGMLSVVRDNIKKHEAEVAAVDESIEKLEALIAEQSGASEEIAALRVKTKAAKLAQISADAKVAQETANFAQTKEALAKAEADSLKFEKERNLWSTVQWCVEVLNRSYTMSNEERDSRCAAHFDDKLTAAQNANSAAELALSAAVSEQKAANDARLAAALELTTAGKKYVSLGNPETEMAAKLAERTAINETLTQARSEEATLDSQLKALGSK